MNNKRGFSNPDSESAAEQLAQQMEQEQERLNGISVPDDQFEEGRPLKPMDPPIITKQNSIDAPITEYKPYVSPTMGRKTDMENQIGYIQIKNDDLPTRAMFYPEEVRVSIRAAKAGEIRHWSTIDDTNVSDVDDKINYVIERCVSAKTPQQNFSWKDLKEIDRIYLLFAIRELTFKDSKDSLRVVISEGNQIPVTKEMIDFIQFDDRVMRYYDAQKRMFVLKLKNGSVVECTIPSIGVVKWLKEYVIKKRNSNLPFDEDYISFAPFLITNYKRLNDKGFYEEMVTKSNQWSIEEVSALAFIKQLFKETINPEIHYFDTEAGADRTAPLAFQGGFRSLFVLDDIDSIFA